MLHLVVFNTFFLSILHHGACTYFYDGDEMFRARFSKEALLCVRIITLSPEEALHIRTPRHIPLIFIQELRQRKICWNYVVNQIFINLMLVIYSRFEELCQSLVEKLENNMKVDVRFNGKYLNLSRMYK